MTRISKKHKYEILRDAIHHRVELLNNISSFASGAQLVAFIAEKNYLQSIRQDLNRKTCDGLYIKLQTLFDIHQIWKQKSEEIVNSGAINEPYGLGKYCAYKFVIDLYNCMPEYW